MKYYSIFKSTLKSIKKNPIIILPDLFFYIITYLMAIFFYRTSGIDSFVKKTILVNAIEVEQFNQFVSSNWFSILVSAFAFIVATFLIGIGIDVVRYRLLKRITLKKPLNFFKAIFSKNPYFVRVFLMKIYVYIINIFLITIATIAIAILYQTDNSALNIIIKLLSLLFSLIIIFSVNLALQYRFAVLFLDNEKRSLRALRKSLKLFLVHTKQVFYVWVILLFTSFVVWLLVYLIGNFANYLQQFTSTTTAYMVLSFISISIINLIRIIYNIFENLYIFKTYHPIKKS